MSEMVELQRYPNSAHAALVRGRLAQDGIDARMLRGSRYQAMGGSGWILRVPTEDLARARAIIDSISAEIDLDEYIDPRDQSRRRCPACRSVMLSRAPLAGWRRGVAWATLGLALPFLEKLFQCRKCGQAWRAR
ncbi:MAG: DUF2007 domain-containing protein [Candidatus Hydrogenedentes bacterium]|nr:DUF2007 domain-containing protein [Candidatus Hydrogenedentota bacterium]